MPKDLNARAQMALRGFSDAPQDDILALLRSDQIIDHKTRTMLARAIAGGPPGLILKVSNSRKSSRFTQLLRAHAHVSQGRSAIRRFEELGYDRGLTELAEAMSLTEKSAASRVALARKVDAWLRSVRAKMPEHRELDELTLETAFLLAKIDKVKPAVAIDDDLALVVDLIRKFREQQSKSLGPDEWFVA